MQSFTQIIQNIRTTSINAKQAGIKFEILVLRWFLATSLYDVKLGCVNGSSQLLNLQPDIIVLVRTSGFYDHDMNLKLRTATNNDQVAAIYKQYLEDTLKGLPMLRIRRAWRRPQQVPLPPWGKGI